MEQAFLTSSLNLKAFFNGERLRGYRHDFSCCRRNLAGPRKRRQLHRPELIRAEIAEPRQRTEDDEVADIGAKQDAKNRARYEVIQNGTRDVSTSSNGVRGHGPEDGPRLNEIVIGKPGVGRWIRGTALSAVAAAGTAAYLGREGIDLVIDGFVNGPHLVIASAIGLSAFIQSLTGFGFAIVAVGGLSQIEWIANSSVFDDLQPVAATFGSFIGWSLLLPEIQKVQWKRLLPLLIATTLATPIGAFGIEAVGETITLKILGALITAYVGYSLLGVKTPKALGGKWGSIIMGGIAGMFGGAFDIQGPPLVVHGDAAEWNAGNGDFRRNLLAVISTNGTMVLLFDFLTGRLEDYYVADFVGNSIPFVIVGITAGRFLSKKLDASGFKKIVLGLCALMGMKLLLQ